MEGKLCFIYMPVHDIKSALKFYRDQLDLEESWREGDLTVAFKLPGTEIELMLDQIVEGSPEAAGPVFILPSADAFYNAQQGQIEFIGKPSDIPGGRWVAARDVSGNGLYFLDQSTSREPVPLPPPEGYP